MTIGFHYHIPATVKEDGNIYMPGYLAVFLEGLARQCNEVVCFLHEPLASEYALMDHAIKADNVKLVNIGLHESMLKRTLKFRKYMQKILPHLAAVDIMLIRGPSPLLAATASLCKKHHTPYSYLLVGDYLKSLAGVTHMNPAKRFLLWGFYRINKTLQDHYAKNALIFTNNRIIYDEYRQKHKYVYEIRTTTLSKDNLFQRKNTCTKEPVRLAYAGRIEPLKGIEDMLDTVKLLQKEGIAVQLHIAGWDPSANEKYLKILEEKVERDGLGSVFFFHGKKKVGHELFSFYRENDIFIIATKGNEGFPRTIWEAMAQSMPVISTKVGSIPDMLDDEENVLLIDQNSPVQLAEAVKRLLNDSNLRKRLIHNGYRLAETNTTEIQSKKMIETMQGYIDYE